jgi:heme/copper-type cytochrome/quinol oxidase subunit 2
MRGKSSWWKTAGLAIAMMAGGMVLSSAVVAQEKTVDFTVANVLFEGSKMFVPATLVVHKGDLVKIKILNNIQSEPPNHGFAIPEFKVEVVVNRGEPQTVEFTADKAGIFDIKCHLHPAHIHGQLIVQE